MPTQRNSRYLARLKARRVKVRYSREKRSSRILEFILTFVSLKTTHPNRYRGLMAVLAVAALAGIHHHGSLFMLGGELAMAGAAIMVYRLFRLDMRAGVDTTRLSIELTVIGFLIFIWVALLILLPIY